MLVTRPKISYTALGVYGQSLFFVGRCLQGTEQPLPRREGYPVFFLSNYVSQPVEFFPGF